MSDYRLRFGKAIAAASSPVLGKLPAYYAAAAEAKAQERENVERLGRMVHAISRGDFDEFRAHLAPGQRHRAVASAHDRLHRLRGVARGLLSLPPLRAPARSGLQSIEGDGACRADRLDVRLAVGVKVQRT